MLKIKIFSPGKTKDEWLSTALAEYEKRLSKDLSIEWIYGYQGLEKEHSYLCLDPQGESFTSPAFSKFLYKKFEESGSRLTIVIGESEGIPEEIKEKANRLISFSPLTFTHQMTRLILLEQLYRAVQIEKGSAYHK